LRDERIRTSSCAAWNCRPSTGEHIHAGERLALEQHGNVVAVDSRHFRFLESHRAGLVRVCSSIDAKPKNSPGRRLVDDHFLLVLIDCADPYKPRDHDVRTSSGIAGLVDPLPRGEFFNSTWPARTAVSSSSSRAKSGTFLSTSGLQAIGASLGRVGFHCKDSTNE